MAGVPAWTWLLLAAIAAGSGVHGLRGVAAIVDAARRAELDRLAHPPHWMAVRVLASLVSALPVLAVSQRLGVIALAMSALVAGFVFWLSPEALIAIRRRVERRVLDDLPLHLDLMAVAMESGCQWSAALSLCVERVADGPLRRAWQRVLLEVHAGTEPLDALRALEQRLRLAPFATLVSALRASEKLQVPAAVVLRERARQTAASRFARAERRARAVPLKLWAVMLLCLVPCAAVTLAIPLVQLWAWWAA
jgi:pilus assembly protein TadC